MKEIIIEPHIGIGQLKLGMTSDELENALLQMKKQWSNSSDEAMQMECCAETDDPNLITGRYMDNDSFFLVQYRNGKATEIGIQRDLSKVASIKLFGMDMFNTTAECIIAIIHSAVVLNMSIPNSFIDATLDRSLWMPISVAFPFRYCTRKNESLSIYRPVIKLGSSVSAQHSICIASSEEFDHCFFICRRAFSNSSDVMPNFNCPIPICGSIIISFITKPYTKK